MVRMRTRTMSCLLVSLMLTTMVSGCIDNPFSKGSKATEAADGERSVLDAILGRPAPDAPGPVDPDDGTDLGGSCDDCIGLRPPGTLPEVQGPAMETDPASADAGPHVTVPLPRAGDLVAADVDPRIKGLQHDSTHAAGSEDPAMRFTGEPDLYYHVVDQRTGRYTSLFDLDHASSVLFVTMGIPEARANPWRDRPDGSHVEMGHLEVSLRDRATLAQAERRHDPQDDAWLAPGEDQIMDHHRHDRGQVPFELGSDLWGRTLVDDASFVVERQAPGHPGTVARFTYTVRSVSLDGTADLVVVADDAYGTTASWKMLVSADSPYPTQVHRLWVGEAGDETTFLPLDVERRTLDLLERGDRPIAWGPVPDVTGRYQAWSADRDQRFRLEDRLAPPVLDEQVRWGISEAVDELFLLAPSFSPFMARHPDRVLVAATLAPQTTVATGAAAGSLVWTLTFTDGTGGLRSWALERALAHDDQVVEVTHHVAEVSSPDLPEAVRALRHGDLRTTLLARGDHAGEMFQELGARHHVNRVDLRLEVLPDGTVGGTMLLGHVLPEVSYRQPREADGVLGGWVVQDLHVGDIVETVRIQSR